MPTPYEDFWGFPYIFDETLQFPEQAHVGLYCGYLGIPRTWAPERRPEQLTLFELTPPVRNTRR